MYSLGGTWGLNTQPGGLGGLGLNVQPGGAQLNVQQGGGATIYQWKHVWLILNIRWAQLNWKPPSPHFAMFQKKIYLH